MDRHKQTLHTDGLGQVKQLSIEMDVFLNLFERALEVGPDS